VKKSSSLNKINHFVKTAEYRMIRRTGYIAVWGYKHSTQTLTTVR